MTRLVVLVSAIVVTLVTSADSYDGPRCSTECPVTTNPKLGYETGYTYVYNQWGKSHLSTQGVRDATTDLRWQSKVELAFLTPCDLAIRIKDYEADGKNSGSVSEMAKVSERPLMVAVSDGRVQHVCVDPEDDAWSVNTKMSVASYLQNTLPTFSQIHSGYMITERDIQGRCPTNYTLTSTYNNQVEVFKEKNNKQCLDRYYTASETMNNIPWLNMPLPLEESNSTCTQRIQDGVYTSIECTDINVIKPMYGFYKHVKATQKSTLEYESQSLTDSNFATFSSNKLVRKDLKFDFSSPKKTEAVMSKIDDLLTETCSKVQGIVEDKAADLVFRILNSLRQAPDSFVQTVLDNIRQGRYCNDWTKLESVYLDAVAFLGESGSIPVMVQEIVQERVSGGRTALYAAAFHMIPRPNIEAVGSLVQIMNMPNPPQSVLLASASMINTYCRQNEHCYEEGQVQQVIKTMVNKVITSRTDSYEEQSHVKLYLRALANIGHFDEEDSLAIMSFLEDKGVDTSVRIAATQTWRIASCDSWNTRRMMNIFFDRTEKTEVRIASYLSFIRCVTEAEDMEEVVKVADEETNVQVRGFVLSHLSNLQETDSPHKGVLRYLLSNVALPDDYGRDIRKFSRNTELSYFLNRLGLGAEIDSNLVYSPESAVPRSVNLNVTVDMFGNMVNVGEVGARMEGFNSVANEVFRPNGYLMNTPWRQMVSDIRNFGYEKGIKIERHLKESLRFKKSVEFSDAKEFIKSNLLTHLEESPFAKADFYLRLFGQEVTFSSLSSDLQKLTSDDIIEAVFAFINRGLKSVSKFKTNTTRALPISLEYSIPTMQGIPLQLELGGAAVLGLDLHSKLNIPRLLNKKNAQAFLELSPSLSLELDGFIGFKSVFKHGLKMKNSLHTSHGGKFKILNREDRDMVFTWILPEKWDLVSFRSETFMMKEVERDSEVKVPNPSVSDARKKSEECTNALDEKLGLRFCYSYNVPDLLRSTATPFGEPLEFSLSAEKTEKAMEGYWMVLALTNTDTHKTVDMWFDTPGSLNPRRSSIRFGYTKDHSSLTTSFSIRTALLKYTMYSSFVSVRNFKSIELFWNYRFREQEKAIAFKSDLRIKKADKVTRYELVTYYSPTRRISPESVQLECSLTLLNYGGEYNVDMKANTKNDLDGLVRVNMTVGLDGLRTDLTSVSQLPRLRKWEVVASAGKWRAEQMITTTLQSDQVVRWSNSIDVVKGRRTFFGAKHDIEVRGTLESNAIVEGTAQVTSGKQQMTSLYSLTVADYFKKIEGNWDIVESKSTRKLFFTKFSYEWKESREPSIDTKFEIQLPSYMEKFAIDTHVGITNDMTYNIEGKAAYGTDYLYKIQGPVTFQLTRSGWIHNMEVIFTGLPNGPHTVTTQLNLLDGEKKVGMSLADGYDTLFNIFVDVSTSSREETNAKANLKLFYFVDVNFNGWESRNGFSVDFDATVFPGEYYTKRLQGSLERDISTKLVKSALSLDLDNDPSKKVGIEVTYDYQGQGPFSVSGGLTWKGEVYRYEIEVILASPLRRFEGHNAFNLKWTPPSQERYEFEVFLDKNLLHTQKPSMNGRMSLESSSGSKAGFECVFEHLGRPYEFKLDTKATMEDMYIPDLKASLEVVHQETLNGREISAKVDLTSLRDEPLIAAEFLLQAKPSDWKCDFNAHLRGRNMATIKAEGPMPYNGTLSAGDYNLQANLPSWYIQEYSAHAQIRDGSAKIRITMDDNYLTIENASPYSWIVEVETPSRSAEVKIDPSQALLQMWGDRDKTYLQFELGGRISTTNSRGQESTQVEVHMRSPALSKDRIISVDYVLSPGGVSGAAEIDIFSNSDEKMTLTFTATRKGEGSYRTEASISAKALEFAPSLVIDTAMTNHTKSIDVQYKHGSSQPEKLVSVAYQNIAFGESSLSAVLQTSTVKEEFFGVLRQEETNECYGYKFHTNYEGHPGQYEAHGSLCHPAHIEMVAFRKDLEIRKYHLNFGLKNPSMAEINLYLEDTLENPSDPYAEIAGLKVELSSPVLLNFDVQYDDNHFQNFKDEVYRTIWAEYLIFDRGLRSTFEELQIQIPSLEIDRAVFVLIDEVGYMLREMKVMSTIEDLLYYLHNMYLYSTVEVRRHYSEMYFRYKDFMSTASRPFTPGFIRDLQEVITVLRRVKELYVSGRMSADSLSFVLKESRLWQPIEEILNKVEREYKNKVEREYKDELDAVFLTWSRVVRSLTRWMESYSIARNYPQIWDMLSHVADRILEDLWQDVSNLRRRLGQRPFFRKLADEFFAMSSQDIPDAKEIVDYFYEILENRLLLNIDQGKGHLQVLLPLNSPVYSLITLPYGVRISNELPIWMRLLGFFQLLVSPRYNLLNAYTSPSAVYYGDGNMYTWDGAMFHVPVSNCPYVLATDGWDHVTVHIQPDNQYEFGFTSQGGKHEISIDKEYNVYVDRQRVRGEGEVEYLDENVVTYQSPEEVGVRNGLLRLSVSKSTPTFRIYANPELQGHLKGLMGTLNEFRGDEMRMPDGNITSDPATFVKSWQTDPYCR